MTRFYSETLAKHDRSVFASGDERVDRYFQETVTQDIKRRYAACYVLVDQNTELLAGFYTLSSHSIAFSNLPASIARRLPRCISVPTVLIGWMGRNRIFRGQRVHETLLADAIARISVLTGIDIICSTAHKESAAAFYHKHNFTPFLNWPLTLYLPMRTALDAKKV